MKALIIINGDLPDSKYIEPLLPQCERIICADGGANRALQHGIRPHSIVGDFDSITDETRAAFSQCDFIHKPSQYATDFEKTLQYAIDEGVTSATILGISGARFDHQLANLHFMEKFCHRIELDFVDDSGRGFFVSQAYKFAGHIGQQVSLHALRRVEGITTKGLKYPLINESLEWAVRDGQSNEIVANPVKITVKSGNLFVFVCHAF
ncbi:MAG: thiamine diphosphokinase [Deferribacteres bacterium]|nr:thiamine diphosphokinase [candidate division KSB1 bacterium]MCB9503610.1 thiamine diphosphokinase [Deferribacteres bacterium]